MVMVIVCETVPIQGATLVACKVKVIIPVSLIPGMYLGFKVLIVAGSIVPVPFSVQV